VYTNLHNSYFKYLVGALREGRILPTDEPAEDYNKNPYLWPIHPYKFTCLFERASTLMSTLSENEYTLLLSLPSLASQINPSTQSSLPDTIFSNNREQPPEPESKHEFSQSQPAIPTPAVLASLESFPATMSTKFNVSASRDDGINASTYGGYRVTAREHRDAAQGHERVTPGQGGVQGGSKARVVQGGDETDEEYGMGR